MKKSLDLSLYLVTDRKLACGRALEHVVQDALDGGVTLLQLREKHAESGEFIKIAKRMRDLTREAGIPLLINDRADIALAVDADGVHLGQLDMSCADARKILGKDAIIGLSVTNVQQAELAEKEDLDYIGVGPIFFTMTKENGRPPIGYETLREIRAIVSHPIVAIGGLKIDNIEGAIEAGADGVAVVSAIMAAQKPREATQELINSVRKLKAALRS